MVEEKNCQSVVMVLRVRPGTERRLADKGARFGSGASVRHYQLRQVREHRHQKRPINSFFSGRERRAGPVRMSAQIFPEGEAVPRILHLPSRQRQSASLA